jgi:hypothetical protein
MMLGWLFWVFLVVWFVAPSWTECQCIRAYRILWSGRITWLSDRRAEKRAQDPEQQKAYELGEVPA